MPKKPPPLPDHTLEHLRLGMFADWKPPTDEELRRARHELGCDDIILGVWPKATDGSPWEPPRLWPVDRVLDRVHAAKSVGLRPVVMAWAVRSRAAIDSMCEYLKAVAVQGVCDVLLDCEGHWHRGRSTGGRILPADAGKRVQTRLRGLQWGVTGLARVHTTLADIGRRAAFVCPQAYSIWKPGGAHWSHSASTFPATMQAGSFASWAAVNPQVVMGLSCYWAGRPKSSAHPTLHAWQTMRMAAAETIALYDAHRPNITPTAWYWSLKWALANNKHGRFARRFFGANP
jgi:hypothetical protein